MDEPKRLDLTPEELDAFFERLEKNRLTKEDRLRIKDIIAAVIWMGQKLEDKDLSIRRLQRLFGIKTEKAENIFGKNKKDDGGGGNSGSSGTAGGETPVGGSGDDGGCQTKCGGQHGADDYPDAEKIIHSHESLKVGDTCPDCAKGTLYLYGYGSVVRLVGQPAIRAVIHQPEQLRCSACLKLFTAKLPDEVSKGRADPTAKSMVAIFRYGSGIPFYRNEGLQEGLRTPLPDSTQWDMSEEVGNCAWPIFNELIDCAATSDLIHLDDTGGKILSLMREIKHDNRERKGIYTTGVLAKTYEGREICLMFTGNRHAGENVQALLDKRPELFPTVKLMCDALSRNEPKKTKVILGNCNDHARREFVDLIPAGKNQPPPDECVYFISRLGVVYYHDSLTIKMTQKKRLEYHKKHSRPIMDELCDWCWLSLENNNIEPNSSMGSAMKYFINHYEELVKFTEVEGMPLSNAAVERLLKTVVLHRKNSLFYKTENGAAIGDILMSVIQTAKRSGVNVFDYLTDLQRNKTAVKKNPKAWLPWNYQQQHTTLQISH
jgi:hypothetical protein